MKKLLIAAAFFPMIAYAQKNPSEEECAALFRSLPKIDSQYEWTEVVQVDSSFKKDDLYRNAKLFFTNEFKSAHDVLQYDDRTEGKIVGKGNFSQEDYQMIFTSMVTDKRYVNFALEVYAKDGRYKYRIYGLNIDDMHRSSSGSGPNDFTRQGMSIDEVYQECTKGMTKKMSRRMFAIMISQIQSTITDLKKAMTNPKKEDF